MIFFLSLYGYFWSECDTYEEINMLMILAAPFHFKLKIIVLISTRECRWQCLEAVTEQSDLL